MPFRCIIFAVVCLIFGSASTEAEIFTFPGIGDASAAVAIDDRTIIVGDDENPWLSIYDVTEQRLVKTVPLPFAGPAAGGGRHKIPEADIEGATVFKGRIVWISSHGRDKDGVVQDSRFQLFASHTLNRRTGAATEAFSASFHDLLPLIVHSGDHRYEPLLPSIGSAAPNEKLAPKKRGFNIEGLAATPDGDALLIGLRNPQLAGKAILMPLHGFDAFLDGTGRPRLGKPIPLDLGERGIRDIAWSPAHSSYVIVAGQVKDDDLDDHHHGPGFALYKWSGDEHTGPELIHNFGDIKRDFHPEAVVPLLERSSGGFSFSKNLLILSDDGSHLMADGKECKDKKRKPADKQFRAVIRQVD